MKTVESLLAQLEQVAVAWQAALKPIGLTLVALEDAGHPVHDTVIPGLLYQQFKMPIATAECAMRWARGDFGDDVTATMLLGKCAHTTLAAMTTDTILAVVNGRHTIASPDESKVVTKTIAQMSRRECSRNLTTAGMKPVGPEVREEPEFRAFRAGSYEICGQDVVFIGRMGGETTRVRVNRSLVRQAAGEGKAKKRAG